MTEAKIKEEISLHLFGALASKQNKKVVLPRIDEGVDILLQLPRWRIKKNRFKFSGNGEMVGIQIKTTTYKQIEVKESHLTFDLSVKNYDDLILAKNDFLGNEFNSMPQFLVLHLLPEERKDWVSENLEKEFYQFNGIFYWYFPKESESFSKNEYYQRIKIPKENKIGFEFFDFIFNFQPKT